MANLTLHHVSVITRDLERSTQFYVRLFELDRLPRPAFSVRGTWLAAGPSLQLHLVAFDGGSFRTGGVHTDDGHYAFRTADFDAFVSRAEAMGFREDAPEDDPMRMIVRRQGMAGFPQLYLMDPDRNIIEVNGAT